MKRIFCSFALSAACMLLSPAVAGAFSLDIQPLSLTLNSSSSGTLQLHNTGRTPIKVQALSSVWTQDGSENMILKTSDDLIMYPPLISIAPDGVRTLRIGLDLPDSAVERAYRVTLVDVTPATAGARLQMGTRFTIPIYTLPPSPHAVIDVVSATIHRTYLDVRVRNSGNAHTLLRKISADVKSGMNAILGHGERTGWYILADSTLIYRLPLSGVDCGAAYSAAVTFTLDSGNIEKISPITAACTK